MNKKSFDISVILSITSCRLLCKMDDIHKILSYMTDADVFTHQLPRIAKECIPLILEEHPKLKKYSNQIATTSNLDEMMEIVKKASSNLADNLEIPKLKYYEHIDPIEEANKRSMA